MAEFKLNVKTTGTVKILNLIGYLDAHTAPELESLFDGFIQDGAFRVVVNFKDLKYISSAGLGVFMAYIETMRESGGDIKFAEMNESIFNVFDLLGFPLIYEFFDSESEAIQKFNGN